jgi:aldehyde oxidoreductase
MKITVTVNGKRYQPEIPYEDMTLLSYLRDVLHLTAAKNGCGEGHCGACTVIIDGRAELSCVKKLATMDGKVIETLESLSTEKSINSIQYAFIMEGAIQCGFCTPGMIMAVKALLDDNENPNEKEIRKALVRNICRCTGYMKILKAVRKAVELRHQGVFDVDRDAIFPPLNNPLGTFVPRADSVAKATGAFKFSNDLQIPAMLYTKVVRSSFPHAKIEAIDISQARNSQGVAEVLTAKDIPGLNLYGVIERDQPVLCDSTVRYIGDAVAAVYAESERQAAEAVEKIRITYTPLPILDSPEAALREGAIQIHTNKKNNILAHMESGRGDTVKGFEEADVILEERYSTQFIEHAYLEPESCIAVPEPDCRISIYVGSQGPEEDIKQIALALAVPPGKIHIAHVPPGGAFGGKEDISVQIIAALGALITQRPVNYTFSRRESIRVTGKRHAQSLHYKTGATKDGRLTALEARIIADTGAYASAGEAVIMRSVSFAGGPYCIDNVSAEADAVFTNKNPACAMRGFGNPTVTFASEVQLNRLAEKLKMDPFEIRLKNVLVEGSKTITGDMLKSSVGARECLLAVREALQKSTVPSGRNGWKVGVGVAASYKNVGLGAGMEDYGGAFGEIIEHGMLLLRIGSVDMGQGSDTTMAQIACETIGWPYNRIIVQSADSDRDPLAWMTTASRQTYVTGNAVYRMALDLKEKLFEFLRSEYGLEAGSIEITGGSIVDRLSRDTALSLSDLAARLKQTNTRIWSEYRYVAPKTHMSLKEPPTGHKGEKGRLHFAYCFAAQAVILEVHEHTGAVNVLKVIAASDTGKPVNPSAVEGQIEGGVVMGLGYALSEEYRIEQGRIITDTFGKLGLPRIGVTPEIECILIENPLDSGPYGAKGMGELPISPVAPAVISAIHDAVGVWITSIPATPAKIAAALRAK